MEYQECNICSTKFSTVQNYRRHVRRFHPGEENEVIHVNNRKRIRKCEKCNKSFTNLARLKRHKRSVHKNCQHKCVFCQFTDRTRLGVIKHYEGKHNVALELEELVFKDEEEFKTWKNAMEEHTSSFFSKTQTFNDAATGFNRLLFVCNRSGNYKPKGKGVRKLRSQGSLKIDGVCPAEINTVIHDDNKHVVKYLKSHCGHKNDYRDQCLTKDRKENIAIMIAAGVPYRVILDEGRDSITSNTRLERNHFLSRKDLYNIASSFQLQSESTVPVDGLSIEEWIQEMSDRGSVIYYKFKGSFCHISIDLLKDDFVVIIMNQGQADILETHASNCICVDRTHRLNADKMELISLLVVDDEKNGFPCAFLISNRIDTATISLFYSCIKRRIGKPLQPNIFMSDIEDIFYSSWLKVMGTPRFRFFCPWHVEIAWRNALQKINSRKLQSAVYKDLKFLQQEAEDEEDFDCCLDDFLETYLVKETVDFEIYFQQKFMSYRKLWAQYYKSQNGITLPSDLQTVHEEISRLYVGRNNNRLNMAITAIMNYFTNKLLEKMSRSDSTTEIDEQPTRVPV